MLCDICNKNQATVHLTEIIDDQMNELHLCEACAHKKSIQMEQKFGLSDLLAGLAEFGEPQEHTEKIAVLKCSNCGLTYKEFKRIGRLGCGQCYSSFRVSLAPLLRKIHGSSRHIGKSPYKLTASKANKKVGIVELQMKLQEAIEKEEFEEAARLRDKIRELERNS